MSLTMVELVFTYKVLPQSISVILYTTVYIKLPTTFTWKPFSILHLSLFSLGIFVKTQIHF